MTDFLNSAFSWIGTFFVEIFTDIYTLFILIIDWIVDNIILGLDFIYEWLREAAFAVIDPVLFYLDSSPFGDFDFLPKDLFVYLNFFFPLTELIYVLSVLLSFWLIILTVKIILKAIPTIY